MISGNSESTTEKQVDNLLSNLGSVNWTPGLTRQSYAAILSCGFRGDNSLLASIATEIVCNHQPLTLRSSFYQVVSTGFLPSTDKPHYNRTGRLMSRLRERGIVPYSWIVDSLRQTQKPSSWSGLNDFADTVRGAYRMDFWEHLPEYVHVFCEKDAIAGSIFPVTEKYDVALSPVRGYCSDSFAYQVGQQFSQIEKPIHCYYVGDYDPSGFDIERDLKKKLRQHSGIDFEWTRLGVNKPDFDEFNLIKLKPKKKDKRSKQFIIDHGNYAAEIDAIPPNALRARIESAILEHISAGEWERLQEVERIEQESWQHLIGAIQ